MVKDTNLAVRLSDLEGIYSGSVYGLVRVLVPFRAQG